MPNNYGLVISGTIAHNLDSTVSLYRSKLKCISLNNKKETHLCGACGKKFNYFDKLHSLIRLDHQTRNLYVLCYNKRNNFVGKSMQAFAPITCHKKCANNTIKNFSKRDLENLKFARVFNIDR
ncbi:MAG: hypothetical protein RLZZ210_733 [Pseudomonadota bacterium]|jgi:hypothetical protein